MKYNKYLRVETDYKNAAPSSFPKGIIGEIITNDSCNDFGIVLLALCGALPTSVES